MRKARGFTLFEVILSVTIVVMITATMAESLNIAFKLKRSTEHAVEMVRDTRVVADIAFNDLANIVVPDPSYTYDGMNAAANDTTTATADSGIQTVVPIAINGPFYGDNEKVWFYTSATDPKSPVHAGVRYEELGMSAKLEDVFARRVNYNLLSDVAVQQQDGVRMTEDLVEEPLITNVVDVKFQYYDGTDWQDSWDSTTTSPALPFAIRIELHLKGAREGDEDRVISRVAPILVAQPAPDTSTTNTGILN
jgi:type II secretory pathway component PulJ